MRIESSVTSVSWIPREAVDGMVWSTLALEIRADQTAAFEVFGASSFPRHWIYGHDGTLQAKTGLIDGVLAVEQDGQQVAEVARGRRDGG